MGQDRPRLRRGPRSSSAAARPPSSCRRRRPASADSTGVRIELPKAKHTHRRSAARTAPRSGTPPWATTWTPSLDDQGPGRGERRHATSRSAPGTTSRRATTTASSRCPPTTARTWDTVTGVHRLRHGPLGRRPDRRPLRLPGQDGPHPLRVHDRRRRAPSRAGRLTDIAVGNIVAAGVGLLRRRLDARGRRVDANDRPLLHRRVPHLRRLRREPPELLPGNYDYAQLGRLVRLQPRPAPASTATRSTRTTTWPPTPGRGGWMVVDAHPKPDGVAYTTARRLRRVLAAAHPGARRGLQPEADADAEHLLRRLRPGLRRRREHRCPARPHSRRSTTPGPTGTPTRRRPGSRSRRTSACASRSRRWRRPP